MIRVDLSDAECGKLAAFYDAESKSIAARLAEAKPESFVDLAKELTELARLAGKLEAARAMSRASAPMLIHTHDEPLGQPTDDPSDIGGFGVAMDAGVSKRVKK